MSRTRSRSYLLVLAIAGCTAGPDPGPDPDPDPDPASSATSIAAGTVAASPHVVVFMIDDLDGRSFERLLAGHWLPRIEAELVGRGTTFDHFYTTDSICCPSRATFFTGQYVHNHGVLNVTQGSNFIYPTDATGQGGEATFLPTWLAAAGYHTALFGKYLNGYGYEDADARTRIPPGWDRWWALEGPTTYSMYGYDANDDGTVVTAGTADADYQTDAIRSRVVAHLAAIDPATPQFVYIAPTAPHTEVAEDEPVVRYDDVFAWTIRPAPRHLALIDGDPANGEVPAQDTSMPSYNEPDATFTAKPGWMQDLPRLDADARAAAAAQYKQRLAAMIAIDDLVGATLDALDARGMLDDTLVVFTADNGYLLGEHRLGQKGVPYEEAMRVPLVVRAPYAGTGDAATTSAVAANHDLAVTIADYAGATAPTARTPDGRSLRALLDDAGAAWPRGRVLVAHFQEPQVTPVIGMIWPHGSVRTRTGGLDEVFTAFDVVRPDQVTTEYYRLGADPYQIENLAIDLGAAQIRAHRDQLEALQACAGAACSAAEDAD